MVFSQLLKDLLHVVAVFGLVSGVNEDVVNIDDDELMEELPEHLIHEPLEDGWSVSQSIRHKIFIVASRGDKGRLPLVSWTDTNEIVGTSQVQFGEDASPTEFLQGSWS